MKKKYWIIILIVALIIAYFGYNYIYQDHRDIATEKVAFTIEANDLANAFKENTTKAEKQYLNQTIIVTGDVTETNNLDLTLNDVIFCSFNKKIQVSISTKLLIKGRCIGYDELLEQVKLDQCTIQD